MSEFSPTPAQNEPHPYQKLGGWLLFFTIFPLITLPYGLFTQIKNLSQFVYTQDLASILYLLAVAVYFVNLGFALTCSVMVIRRKPWFLLVRQISFFVSTLQIILTEANTVMTTDNEVFALFGLMMIPTLLIMIPIMFYLVMLYYFRSVRVRTYMGSDEYLRRAFFTKKTKGPEPAAPDAAEQTDYRGDCPQPPAITPDEGDL